MLLFHSLTHSRKLCVCNTPRDGRLSTTNFVASKEWKRLLARRKQYESVCRLGQAANATRSATCGTVSGKQKPAGETPVSDRIQTERVTMVLATPLLHKTYFPTTTITNESGFILPRRSPGAGGSKSAAGIKILCVFKSSPMVRALRLVGTFSTTVNLSCESS